MAKAGGTASYYPATSPEQLSAAFSAISQIVTSCTFALPSPPPDPNNVAVYVDKKIVPMDPANGWTYGATTAFIVLNGAYCDRLVTAETTTIQIALGCPGMIPPVCIP
jgi:hypothetical protein